MWGILSPNGVLAFRQRVAVKGVHHEPTAFRTGQFKGSQLRWLTVGKEASAAVRVCSKAGCMLP